VRYIAVWKKERKKGEKKSKAVIADDKHKIGKTQKLDCPDVGSSKHEDEVLLLSRMQER
jgi:hypothetical protein